jgi:Protein of unknown function (DUF2958)
MPHVLIPAELRERLLANGARSTAGEDIDPNPIVKLVTPDANATWLFTELDPDIPTLAFGLCNLGLGSPELGSICLHEIAKVRGPLGLPVERDLHYTETRLISIVAHLARRVGHINV